MTMSPSRHTMVAVQPALIGGWMGCEYLIFIIYLDLLEHTLPCVMCLPFGAGLLILGNELYRFSLLYLS